MDSLHLLTSSHIWHLWSMVAVAIAWVAFNRYGRILERQTREWSALRVAPPGGATRDDSGKRNMAAEIAAKAVDVLGSPEATDHFLDKSLIAPDRIKPLDLFLPPA